MGNIKLYVFVSWRFQRLWDEQLCVQVMDIKKKKKFQVFYSFN